MILDEPSAMRPPIFKNNNVRNKIVRSHTKNAFANMTQFEFLGASDANITMTQLTSATQIQLFMRNCIQ